MEFEFKDQVILNELDDDENGRLGWDVALGPRDLVIAGLPFKAGGGGAFLFRTDDNRELQFVRDFETQGNRYGAVTVTSGDWLAIGNDSGRTPVELFQRVGENYVFRKEVPAPELAGVRWSNWGRYMDLQDDRLIVSDSANVDGVAGAGAAVIFRRDLGGTNNWGIEGILRDPGATPNGSTLGRSSAIDSDVAILGDAPNNRVFVYRRNGNTWSFSKALEGLNLAEDDRFGTSIDVENGIIAVGATNGNNAQLPTNSGSVHIFERNQGGFNQFGQVAEVVGSEATFIDEFGQKVRLRNGILAVGSPNGERAYLFRFKEGSWQEETVVAPPPGLRTNEFGWSVDYRRGSFLVGDQSLQDDDFNRIGAIFLFENDLVRRCGGSFDAVFCDTFEE